MILWMVYTNQQLKLLKKNKYVYEGELSAPKGELNESWKKRKQLLFKSTNFGDDLSLIHI